MGKFPQPKLKITLEATSFEVTGTVELNLWGGGQGTIDMTPVRVPLNTYIDKGSVAQYINDGGFGCESIDYANVHVSIVYGEQYRQRFVSFIYFTDELATYKHLTKRGTG